jgi:hypothetical protein
MNEPWKQEPDRLELKVNGYHALIIRHEDMKHLCGYIAVPKGHPLFAKHYNAINNAHVHGGLTFSSEGMDEHERASMYYKPNEDLQGNKLHWFGFDCAHSQDYTPGTYESMLDIYTQKALASTNGDYVLARKRAECNPSVAHFRQRSDQIYRTVHYVTSELQSLADQFDKLLNKKGE